MKGQKPQLKTRPSLPTRTQMQLAASSDEQEKDTPSGNSKEDAKENEQKQVAEPEIGPKDMPFYPTNKKVAVDNKNLKDFFYLACGEEPTLYSEDTKNDNSTKNENGSKGKKKVKKGRDKSQKDEDEMENLPAEQLVNERNFPSSKRVGGKDPG